jgi:2-iminobutanoate/2-iminopropanoate deaminase
MVMAKTISSDKAPAAVGPYVQAVEHAGVIYCSGQLPINPATGAFVLGSISDQTAQVMDNLRNVLEAAGSGFSKALKVNIFITDLATFAEMNEVYASYFEKGRYPARSALAAAALAFGARVEVECIAAIPKGEA